MRSAKCAWFDLRGMLFALQVCNGLWEDCWHGSAQESIGDAAIRLLLCGIVAGGC